MHTSALFFEKPTLLFAFENLFFQTTRARRISASLPFAHRNPDVALVSLTLRERGQQAFACELPIARLRARVLHGDGDSRGQMTQAHGRRDFVDVLATGSRSVRKSFLQIRFFHYRRLHLAAGKFSRPYFKTRAIQINSCKN